MNDYVWSFDPTKLDEFANDIKEQTVRQLLTLKFITQEQHDEFCGNYSLIIKQRSKFMQFFKRFTKVEGREADNCWSFLWVKLLPPFNGNLSIKENIYTFSDLDSDLEKNKNLVKNNTNE